MIDLLFRGLEIWAAISVLVFFVVEFGSHYGRGKRFRSAIFTAATWPYSMPLLLWQFMPWVGFSGTLYRLEKLQVRFIKWDWD